MSVPGLRMTMPDRIPLEALLLADAMTVDDSTHH